MQNTPTYHRPPFQLHTPIYLKQHTGPLVVSRESGAPADQVEETPGRASLEKLGCRTPPQLHAGGVGRQHRLRTVIPPSPSDVRQFILYLCDIVEVVHIYDADARP